MSGRARNIGRTSVATRAVFRCLCETIQACAGSSCSLARTISATFGPGCSISKKNFKRRARTAGRSFGLIVNLSLQTGLLGSCLATGALSQAAKESSRQRIGIEMSMRGCGQTRVGAEGLTNHSSHDVNGTAAPHSSALEDAGMDQESLSLPSPRSRSDWGEGRGDEGRLALRASHYLYANE
jgi:hypothetical protein